MLPDVQIYKLRIKLDQQRREHERLLERCRVLEDGYRQVVADVGHEKQVVEDKIEQARQSPQKVKWMQDIYLAYCAAESKARDLETTECLLKACEDNYQNKLKTQKTLQEQVHKIVNVCPNARHPSTYKMTYSDRACSNRSARRKFGDHFSC